MGNRTLHKLGPLPEAGHRGYQVQETDMSSDVKRDSQKCKSFLKNTNIIHESSYFRTGIKSNKMAGIQVKGGTERLGEHTTLYPVGLLVESTGSKDKMLWIQILLCS